MAEAELQQQALQSELRRLVDECRAPDLVIAPALALESTAVPSEEQCLACDLAGH